MVTWQQIGQGEPNPFDVTYTTNSPYSASYGEFVITEGSQVDLPSPTPNGAVAVRSFKQTVTITTPSGAIRDIGSKVHLESPEYVLLVSDGTNWYVQSNESGIGRVIPDSGVSRWEFEQDATESWGDNDGTENGSLSYVTDSAVGDYALDLTGGYISTPLSGSGFGTFSFSVWVNPDSFSGRTYLADSTDGAAGWGFRLEDDGTVESFTFSGGSVANASTTATVSTSAYTMLTFVHGSSDNLIYFDDTEEASAAHTGEAVDDPNTTVALGAEFNGSNPMDGLFDDARFYDKELSSTEVSNLNSTGSIDG